MDKREVLAEELKAQKEKLEVLEKELAKEELVFDDNPQYVELELKIFELEEKIKKDRCDPIPPKGSGLGIAASIIAIIAGFFVTKIISIIGAIGFIAVLIPRSISMKKQKKENDALLAPTKEQLQKCRIERQQIRNQYPQLRVLEDQISEVKRSINAMQKEIDVMDAETTRIKIALGTNDISQYEKNYVFVHISNCFNKEISTPCIFHNHRIYIDGQDFGFANLPFVKFEMNPGVHTMKIEYKRGDYFYSTNPIQFRVDEQSKMFTLKYRGASKGGLEIKEYSRFDQFSTFLDETAKK